MIRTIVIAFSAFLVGCAPTLAPPTGSPRNNAVCEGMRPAMPIQFSASKDTPETVKQVRAANARYQAMCL